MQEFKKPDFRNRSLELRVENNEICIYGTKDGLHILMKLIQALIDKPQKGHVHLEDYELLTEKSLVGVVGIFKTSENNGTV